MAKIRYTRYNASLGTGTSTKESNMICKMAKETKIKCDSRQVLCLYRVKITGTSSDCLSIAWILSIPSNPILIFIALNLHLLTDSKALDPSHIQSHSPLTICLIAVGGNRSARGKPTLKSQSGTIPHIPVMVYWWNPHTYITMIYWWNSSAHGIRS